jgi:hypothetical protein
MTQPYFVHIFSVIFPLQKYDIWINLDNLYPILYFCVYLIFEWDFEFSLPKNDLCQVWLILTNWFLKKEFKFVFYYDLPKWMGLVLFCKILNTLIPRGDLFHKNCSSASQDVKIEQLTCTQTDSKNWMLTSGTSTCNLFVSLNNIIGCLFHIFLIQLFTLLLIINIYLRFKQIHLW